MTKLIHFWKPFAWLIIISFLSLMPGYNLPKNALFDIPHLDKIVHFGMYFMLALLLLKPIKEIYSHSLLLASILAFVVSGIFEALQHWLTNNRDGNFYDLLANLAGIIVALLVYKYILKNTLLDKYL